MLIVILIIAIIAIIATWKFVLMVGWGFDPEQSGLPTLDAPYNGMNKIIPFMIVILVVLLGWLVT